MVCATLFAMYANDVRLALYSRPDDDAFAALHAVCFAVCGLELLLNTWAKPGFTFSLFWWLDLVGTLSLTLDIPQIYRPIARSAAPDAAHDERSATSTADERAGASVLASVRAVRVARAIRALRLVRVGRLVRLLRKGAQLARGLAQPGKRRQAVPDWVPNPTELKSRLSGAQAPRARVAAASQAGQILSEKITKQTVAGVLLFVLVYPLLNVRVERHRLDHELHVARDALALVAGAGGARADAATLAVLAERLRSFWNVIRLDLPGLVINEAARFAALRPGEETDVVRVHVTAGDGAAARAWSAEVTFDVSADSRLRARFSMAITTFVALMLGTSVFVFKRVSNTYCIQPIESIMQMVRDFSANPLAKMRAGAGAGGWAARGVHQDTSNLVQSIGKIASLLQIGFGEAGAAIIGANLAQGGEINPMSAGRRMVGLFGFVVIFSFGDTTEALREGVMLYVNRVAAIVHACVHEFAGAINKNIGEAFLMVWPLEHHTEKRQQLDRRRASADPLQGDARQHSPGPRPPSPSKASPFRGARGFSTARFSTARFSTARFSTARGCSCADGGAAGGPWAERRGSGHSSVAGGRAGRVADGRRGSGDTHSSGMGDQSERSTWERRASAGRESRGGLAAGRVAVAPYGAFGRAQALGGSIKGTSSLFARGAARKRRGAPPAVTQLADPLELSQRPPAFIRAGSRATVQQPTSPPLPLSEKPDMPQRWAMQAGSSEPSASAPARPPLSAASLSCQLPLAAGGSPPLLSDEPDVPQRRTSFSRGSSRGNVLHAATPPLLADPLELSQRAPAFTRAGSRTTVQQPLAAPLPLSDEPDIPQRPAFSRCASQPRVAGAFPPLPADGGVGGARDVGRCSSRASDHAADEPPHWWPPPARPIGFSRDASSFARSRFGDARAGDAGDAGGAGASNAHGSAPPAIDVADCRSTPESSPAESPRQAVRVAKRLTRPPSLGSRAEAAEVPYAPQPHAHDGFTTADCAVAGFALCVLLLKANKQLRQLCQNELLQRLHPGFAVNTGYGLHMGWAIEGAIGSALKIDASYLSPNVNLASRLEAATKQYGVRILLSEQVVSVMSAKCKVPRAPRAASVMARDGAGVTPCARPGGARRRAAPTLSFVTARAEGAKGRKLTLARPPRPRPPPRRAAVRASRRAARCPPRHACARWTA